MPCEPVGPVAPVVPGNPCGPVAPSIPLVPLAPVGPCAPVGPVGPVPDPPDSTPHVIVPSFLDFRTRFGVYAPATLGTLGTRYLSIAAKLLIPGTPVLVSTIGITTDDGFNLASGSTKFSYMLVSY
jgi:hypothetical protein